MRNVKSDLRSLRAFLRYCAADMGSNHSSLRNEMPLSDNLLRW